jgi:hypothetical protein
MKTTMGAGVGMEVGVEMILVLVMARRRRMVMLLAMARKYDKYKDISYIRIIKMIIYEENNDNEDHEHENDENSYEEYIIITTDITIWLYTESARAVSRAQISPKSATILGLSRRHLQSVRIQIESVFPEPPARRSKIHCFFGNFRFAFPKKAIVILVFFSSPQSAYHWANAARRSRTVRGSIPPKSVPTPCELLPLLA